METLSHAELTSRLGRAPKDWTFLGQCYEAGEGTRIECAVTRQQAHICFTLKHKDGTKGRQVISAEAIPQLERWAPELYCKLRAGNMFLELRRPAIQADIAQADVRARINAAMAKYDSVRKEAKGRVRGYQKENRRTKLPAYLEALRQLLLQTGHYFKDEEDRAFAIEQKTIQIEQVLAKDRAAEVVIPAPQPEAVETLTKVPAGIDLLDIPELDF